MVNCEPGNNAVAHRKKRRAGKVAWDAVLNTPQALATPNPHDVSGPIALVIYLRPKGS